MNLVEVAKHPTGRTVDPVRSVEGDYTISVATVFETQARLNDCVEFIFNNCVVGLPWT